MRQIIINVFVSFSFFVKLLIIKNRPSQKANAAKNHNGARPLKVKVVIKVLVLKSVFERNI